MGVLPEACPIWGETAVVSDGVFDGWTVTGDRTDGAYQIARSVIERVRGLPPEQKAKLTTWIVDQHRAGIAEPMITSWVVDDVLTRRPLTYRQKADRYFLMLRNHNLGLGAPIRIYGLQSEGTTRWKNRLSAWLEISQPTQLGDMLSALQDEGLIKKDPNDNLRPTARGLERLDSLADMGAESDQAFVAMWFGPTMDNSYSEGFEPGIMEAGYRPLRIDKKEHANKIDDEIIAEIRRSRFVVADFTSEIAKIARKKVAVSRGGVYYEAGFAQGLAIPVIWTVRADCMDYVHFDTRQYAHIVWNDPSDLREKLKNRIGAVIGPKPRLR